MVRFEYIIEMNYYPFNVRIQIFLTNTRISMAILKHGNVTKLSKKKLSHRFLTVKEPGQRSHMASPIELVVLE